MDPLRPVRGGDRVRMSASTQNALLGAARAAARTRVFASSEGPEGDDGQILVQATAALGRFSHFKLGAVVSELYADAQLFPDLPAFASAACEEDEPFGIMLDPAAAGNFAPAVVVGLAPAIVSILDSDHQFCRVNASLALESAATGYARIVWKAGDSDMQWCLLQISGGGADAGFPFGPQWPFGLGIDGDTVTVYGATYRHAKTDIDVADSDPITITADQQWVLLKITKGEGGAYTAAIDPTPVTEVPDDTDTDVYRKLFRFAYTEGTPATETDPEVPASCALVKDLIHAPISDGGGGIDDWRVNKETHKFQVKRNGGDWEDVVDDETSGGTLDPDDDEGTGEAGPTGPAGADGTNGADGAPGAAATVAVGTVTTGAAGSSAAVTNAGTTAAAVLNFTIPRGDKGDKGDTGAAGANGTNGTNGTNGANGAPGAKGDQGDPGPNENLGDLLDAQVVSPATGQLLYRNASSKWANNTKLLWLVDVAADGRLILDYSASATRAWNAAMPGVMFKTPADPAGVYSPGIFLNLENNDGYGNRLDMGWGGANGGNFELYSKNHDARPGEFRVVYGGGAYGMVQFTHYDGTNWYVAAGFSKEGYAVLGLKAYEFPGTTGSPLAAPAHPLHVYNATYPSPAEVMHLTKDGGLCVTSNASASAPADPPAHGFAIYQDPTTPAKVKIKITDASSVTTTYDLTLIPPAGDADGQIMTWDATAGKWKKNTVGTLAADDLIKWDATNKQFVKVTPTQITVVTDWQYDTTAHKFQKKTRTCYVLSPGTESGWTDATGAQADEGVIP